MRERPMSKTIYDKWRELLDLKVEDSKVIISNFFLSLSTKTKLYLGVSSESQFIYLEFEKGILDKVELPELKGLEIGISTEATIDKTKEFIKIRNRTNNVELFVAFSSSLCDALLESSNYFEAFNALAQTIKEYRSFFANLNMSLSLQEEQGLCAELLELSKLVDEKGEDTVQCWAGPSRNKRDFLFNTKALEVKSTLGQLDSSILISSENQLTLSFPHNLSSLFLKVYILEKAKTGISVVSCAQEVLAKLQNINNKTFFNINLLKMKVDLGSYKSKYFFSLQAVKQYKILDDFPKITRETLPTGVFNVKYRIHLDAIKQFEITEGDLYGQL